MLEIKRTQANHQELYLLLAVKSLTQYRTLSINQASSRNIYSKSTLSITTTNAKSIIYSSIIANMSINYGLVASQGSL